MKRSLWMLGTLLAMAGCGPQLAGDEAEGEDLAASAQEIRNCPIEEPDCEPLPTTGCAGLIAAPPTTSASYGCDLVLTDKLGRPVSGQAVTLSAEWCNRDGVVTQGTRTAYTGTDGRVAMTLSTRGANILTCRVSTVDPIVSGKSINGTAKIASGTRLTVTASKYPTPTATRFPAGLVAGAGQMDLYQSGNYDRVVVVPEYFDLKENDPTRRRTRTKFWQETHQLMEELYSRGYDVWLFQPSSTGANLHEQAAELAQAIDIAARAYASPSCNSHRVGVVGLNTAGVVARIATARWEADAAWRASLGIPTTTLPVSFLASVDAPQYGLHLNIDLQKFIQDEISGADIHKLYNLDSCAMNQLLRLTRRPDGAVNSNAFKAFFVDGAPVTFYSKYTGADVTCAAGPAVSSLNAARGVPGWPTAPRRFGITFGSSGHVNQCYGDDRDLNGSGDNICLYKSDFTSSTFFTPSVGDSWLKFVVNNWFDRYADARAEDLVPGSRSPFFIDGLLRDGFFDVHARQRFSPTFIPLVSAQGTQGPVGGNLFGTVASPFANDSWVENLYSGVSDVAPAWPMISLFSNLTSSVACGPLEGIVVDPGPIVIGP